MFAETVEDLVAVFRREVDDAVEAPLWSDGEIIDYVVEACDALAKRTNGLFAVVSLPFLANATYVALPAYVLHIRSAKYVTRDCDVLQINANENGLGSYSFVRDYRADRLVFSSAPAQADTLELQCSVTLEAALEADDDLPFTDAEDLRLLLHFIKQRAYEKHDAETENHVRANRFRELFETGVENRAQHLRNQRRSPGVVSMNW